MSVSVVEYFSSLGGFLFFAFFHFGLDSIFLSKRLSWFFIDVFFFCFPVIYIYIYFRCFVSGACPRVMVPVVIACDHGTFTLVSFVERIISTEF